MTNNRLHTMKTSVLVSCLILFSFTSNLHLDARTWTSADGRTIEAEFISADSANVTIKRADGRTFTLPLSRLSPADQDFDDTHVYIASGKVPWYLVAVDRKTKQSTMLAKTANTGGMVTVFQDIHGVTANVTGGPGIKKKQYWCHEGKLILKSQPCPWGKTGTDWKKALPPKPEIYSERIVPPEPGQQAEFWVKATVPGVAPDREHRGWTCFR